MDALLDPISRDYTGTTTTTLQNAVYLRLDTPLGFWWADPSLGSRLYELEREKDTPRVRGLAIQYAEQALQPLIDDGRATSVTVNSADGPTGWLILLIAVVDVTGNTQHFKKPVKVA
jgi:phage gp46-like protein